MNTLIRALVVILLTAFSFSSCKECSKKVPCPGYEDALLDSWFPYHEGQVIVFKSNLSTYDTFALNLTDSTIAYEYSNGYGGGTNGCQASKSFASLKRDTTNYAAFAISLNASTDTYSTSKVRTAFLRFYKKYFTGQGLTENGFSSFSVSNELNVAPQNFTNYALNGIIYPTVQTVITDTVLDSSPGVYKIIYAKNYGIIAYETNPGAVAWIKQ